MLVLPSSTRPAGLAAAHDGGRVRRPVALEHARAGRRGHVADAEQVLVGDRDARDAAAALVCRARGPARACAPRRRAGRRSARRCAPPCGSGRRRPPPRRSARGRRAAARSPRRSCASTSRPAIRRRSGERGSRPPCARARARAAPRAATAAAATSSPSTLTRSSACDVGGTSARSSEAMRPTWSRMPARSRARRLELVGLEPDVREGSGVPNVVRRQAHGSGV